VWSRRAAPTSFQKFVDHRQCLASKLRNTAEILELQSVLPPHHGQRSGGPDRDSIYHVPSARICCHRTCGYPEQRVSRKPRASESSILADALLTAQFPRQRLC